jgi:hypothetical protein
MAVMTIIAIVGPFCFDIPGKFKSILPLHISTPPCFVRQHTGQFCKSCGLARSIIALYHGQFTLSNLYHPLGMLFVLLLLFEFIFRIFTLLFRSPLLLVLDIFHYIIIIILLNISFY